MAAPAVWHDVLDELAAQGIAARVVPPSGSAR